MWRDLWVASALMLVLEGIIPFLNPGSTRQALLMVAEMDDKVLRIVGFACMVVGAILLYMFQ
ncbi:MAG: DUF2065 domain-containing protein [Pseudomonadota bacterium]